MYEDKMRIQDLGKLPLIETSARGQIKYWSIKESGDWAADTRGGREHADALIAICPPDELGMILAHTVNAMIETGTAGGHVVGFMQRIGEIASGHYFNYNTEIVLAA